MEYLTDRTVYNRIQAVMEHTSRYSIDGPARLARDIEVARSTIVRLLSGETNPTFALSLAVVLALEKALNRNLGMREIFSLDGRYPTPSVCKLCDCRGCLPRAAYRADDSTNPAFRGVKPGEWSLIPHLAPGVPNPEGLTNVSYTLIEDG